MSVTKLFLVAGELSGDRIAGWYLTKRRATGEQFVATGIGGSDAQAAGLTLYDHYTNLNVVGITELLKHIPRLLRYINQLADHITQQDINEVVLVDFPGFNLRLAAQLKKRKSSLKITYVSPPQLWVWGAWRVKKIKQYIDAVVVIYPFEVAWYQERGVEAHFIGSPVCDELAQQGVIKPLRQPMVALLPGSRTSELDMLLPLFLRVVQRLHEQFSELRFVLPVAQSIKPEYVASIAAEHRLSVVLDRIELIPDNSEKYATLARCCAALTKPGTVTLELALLAIPSVIAFKTSALSYWIAKRVVKVPYMGLPNLLLQRMVFPEFIQQQCNDAIIVDTLIAVVKDFYDDGAAYQERVIPLRELKNHLTIVQ